MTDLLDPTKAYLLLFTVLILGGLGVGYTAGDRLSVLGSVIFAGGLGFVSGIHASREEVELLASMLVTGGLTALVVMFLPLGVDWGIAVFLIGFILGMRTDRR